jgi:phosphoribosyl 1,2-cyclic phosphodiesterase
MVTNGSRRIPLAVRVVGPGTGEDYGPPVTFGPMPKDCRAGRRHSPPGTNPTGAVARGGEIGTLCAMARGTVLTTPGRAGAKVHHEPTAAGSASDVQVAFWGVRGSTPCAGPHLDRYGGHSSCVVIESDGNDPIIFDLGTGLRPYGLTHDASAPYRGTVLLTHLHWDHVQGLPFFTPLHHPESELTVYGPRQDDGSLEEVFEGLMRPPYFPIRPSDLAGDIAWRGVGNDDFSVGNARVRSRFVPHVGSTLGYRVDVGGVSVAYVSDHGPGCCGGPGGDAISLDVLELCDGVDVLIHDAQHTPEEFAQRAHWGHCTPSYAVHVARESGARELALFHHDPSHDDEQLDLITKRTADEGAHRGLTAVLGAREGMVLDLQPSRPLG